MSAGHVRRRMARASFREFFDRNPIGLVRLEFAERLCDLASKVALFGLEFQQHPAGFLVFADRCGTMGEESHWPCFGSSNMNQRFGDYGYNPHSANNITTHSGPILCTQLRYGFLKAYNLFIQVVDLLSESCSGLIRSELV
jgi:hypothetical protein